jgi:hypothetical protein
MLNVLAHTMLNATRTGTPPPRHEERLPVRGLPHAPTAAARAGRRRRRFSFSRLFG